MNQKNQKKGVKESSCQCKIATRIELDYISEESDCMRMRMLSLDSLTLKFKNKLLWFIFIISMKIFKELSAILSFGVLHN